MFKILIFFFNVFFNTYIILGKNQIWNKKSFWYLFLFSKKGIFSKKGFAQLS